MYYIVPDTLCSLLADKVKRKGQFYLLVFAAVLTVFLVGLWIALAALIYSKWAISRLMSVFMHFQ